MEEDNQNPIQIISVDVNKELQSKTVSLNKKRKYQGEQLGLPLSKHYCWDQSLSSESDSPSNENLTVEDFSVPIIKGKEAVGEEIYDESKPDSAKDSDSFGGGTDPSISSSNRPSHLSVSFDDISVTESRADKKKTPYIGGEHDYTLNDFGVHPCESFDDHLLEFYSCLEDGNDDNIERLVDKELDDMLNANKAGPSTSFVLSSNQETQLSPKKLTIDKEFEQYFSTLLM